jgi:hypothetical protein
MSDKHDSKRKDMRAKSHVPTPGMAGKDKGGTPIEGEIKASAGEAQEAQSKQRMAANRAQKR